MNPKEDLNDNKNGLLRKKDQYPFDEKFMWNFFLVQSFMKIVDNKKWILPIVHGSI